MKVKVKVYDGVKYKEESKKVAEIEYQIEGFEVVTGDRAIESDWKLMKTVEMNITSIWYWIWEMERL